MRVVLVDDQALVRAGFAMVIDSQTDMSVAGQAGDGIAGLDTVRQVQPDVVLMDVRMPRLDGIDATEQILALADEGHIRTPKIIVLTTFDDDEYALRALRAGASGFLLKDTLPEVLLDSIRTVVDGGAVIAPTTTRRLLDSEILPHLGAGQDASLTATSADSSQSPMPAQNLPAQNLPAQNLLDADEVRRLESLTPREREVLTLIAKGLSNTEIGERLFLAQPTVKTHVGRILMKLEVRDRVQAVVLAYEAGLVAPGS
ncbi:response regulator transcription factor [Brevibacterium sp. S111]|uniref:response regulator transcription factor n=1 Tax=Brevibacterium sp. S111 TaxID=2483795 RepID=UPI0010810557|nr:response regulator transcription factor [Brevibacterium sp. S111]TGD08877.1 DNA-binding response regulator [Brevibacterium sp. S111]